MCTLARVFELCVPPQNSPLVRTTPGSSGRNSLRYHTVCQLPGSTSGSRHGSASTFVDPRQVVVPHKGEWWGSCGRIRLIGGMRNLCVLVRPEVPRPDRCRVCSVPEYPLPKSVWRMSTRSPRSGSRSMSRMASLRAVEIAPTTPPTWPAGIKWSLTREWRPIDACGQSYPPVERRIRSRCGGSGTLARETLSHH